MDFSLNTTAFLKKNFNLKSMTGQEKFVALCASLAEGNTQNVLNKSEIRKAWPKGILLVAHHDTYYQRAVAENWVKPMGRGKVAITQTGLSYLEGISSNADAGSPSSSNEGLIIFMPGKTHTFDKHLRSILKNATKRVMIADAYVDDTVFDNLLDEIEGTVDNKLLYGRSMGNFESRSKRYAHEYEKFQMKYHSKLHDRFLIVDGIGYIIGPSLKDAARKSPATFVKLNASDSRKLKALFDELWSTAKK